MAYRTRDESAGNNGDRDGNNSRERGLEASQYATRSGNTTKNPYQNEDNTIPQRKKYDIEKIKKRAKNDNNLK